MATLVSINQRGETIHLRRYETTRDRRPGCTHAGRYAPHSITLANLAYYRAAGAQQDSTGRSFHPLAKVRRLTR